MFTIQKIPSHDENNNPTAIIEIADNATLAQAIRMVQDGIRTTYNSYRIYDNYSGERYTLQELYRIQALAKKGT